MTGVGCGAWHGSPSCHATAGRLSGRKVTARTVRSTLVLSCVAVDFRTAGFDRLERLATVPADRIAQFVAERHELAGAVVVATCNRFEAYLDVPNAEDAERVRGALVTAAAEASGSTADGLLDSARVFEGHAVAEHLFAVASGLESLVLGEGQIAGQVSRALEAARAAGTTTSDLERVFQRAANASSAVQERTTLGSAGRSVVRLALDLVETRLGAWSHTRVVLVGTGAYAGATLAALRDRGVREVAVYSPSGRAARFAHREGVRALERHELADGVGAAHLVIACSIATVPIIDAAAVRGARAAAAAAHRQIIVDLGLPRNVDPDVHEVDDVDLLDLETLSLHAPLPELQATNEAHLVLDRALADYRAAQQATEIVPAIVALRREVQVLVDAEIDRLRAKGASSEAAERALRHLGSVFVHQPTRRAHDHAAAGEGPEFLDAIRRVHGIDADASSASAHPHADVDPHHANPRTA